MKKKCVYVWSLVAALVMTACSSDQNEAIDVAAKTGTFEISIAFSNSNPGGSRASTAVPATTWDNVKQIQFFLYNSTGNIAWSDVVTPSGGTASGTSRVYTYASVPAGTYTLAAVANAKSGSDDVITATSSGTQEWIVGNVTNKTISSMLIQHKAGSWNAAMTGNTAISTAISGLNPYKQPSEVFMGYATGVVVSAAAPAPATITLKREVSLMRVRVDQKTNAEVVSKVGFADPKTAIMLYNLPNQMGIAEGNAGGIGTASTGANTLFTDGVFATTDTGGHLDGNFTAWKDVIVFPNNGGRANNGTPAADATNKYFVVLCGVAQAGHVYAGGALANAGDLVFWYGPIDKVFTPNIIREVNLILKTGGSATPPPNIVEYGGLSINVNEPLPWDSNIQVTTIEV